MVASPSPALRRDEQTVATSLEVFGGAAEHNTRAACAPQKRCSWQTVVISPEVFSGAAEHNTRAACAPQKKMRLTDRLVPERQLMSGRQVVREIVIREAEYEKLVRIRYRRHIRGLQ